MTTITNPKPACISLLDRIERLANMLPDPVMIFVILIVILMVISALGEGLGWSAVNPVSGDTLVVKSLLAEDMIRKLLTELPKTFAAFPPLGMVLTLVIAAGVADQSGLFAAMMRASLARVPLVLLTPVVFLVGSMTVHAVDAGNVVYVPLAGVLYAALGRHPVLGIITAYCGVATGVGGSLLPGNVDILLLSLTQTGAHLIDPDWQMNPLGLWFFSIALCFTYTVVGTLVIERVVAPRLGAWDGGTSYQKVPLDVSATDKRGLRAAMWAMLAVVGGVIALMTWPGYTPLYDANPSQGSSLAPFFGSIVAVIFVLMLACGWAFGAASGSITSHRDVIAMMGKGVEPLIPYLVLVLFAAQFVAMFSWSNLGPITAISGATHLRELGAPPALLLPILATMSAWLDFLIASASAKWTVMALVATPMFMLLGISPEMTTAAYRVGDVVTNLISPTNAYLVLSLLFCQRWVPSMKLGSLIALTLPVAIAFYCAGIALMVLWVSLGIPVGVGAGVGYVLP